MLVLKTTSASASTGAPKGVPRNTEPSSRARADSTFTLGRTRQLSGDDRTALLVQVDDVAPADRRDDPAPKRAAGQRRIPSFRREVAWIDGPGQVGIEDTNVGLAPP